MTRIYYDTEFLETGDRIHLISIGIVTDDGREYYAVNSDLDHHTHRDPYLRGVDIGKTPWDQIVNHKWLVQNVFPHLPLEGGPRPVIPWSIAPKTIKLDHADTSVKPRQVIANEVRDFIQATDDPELWAWYGAYDHVALCWLWGPMVDLPKGVPMWTNDLRQECARLGDPEMPKQADGEHNALADARHNRDMARFLDQHAATMTDGPLRFSHSGWTMDLEQYKDQPAHVTIKRHGDTIIAGYIHHDPPGPRP